MLITMKHTFLGNEIKIPKVKRMITSENEIIFDFDLTGKNRRWYFKEDWEIVGMEDD